jgi:uncharacterized membrane protein
MQWFIDFIGKWSDAIGKVFGEFPIAAAIMTLVAVLVFVRLIKWPITDWQSAALNFFCVLLGWLICVPILGWFFIFLRWIGATGAFFYERYERQPVLFIVLTLLAVVGGAVWILVFRRRGPSANMKIGIVVAGWFIGILLLVPLFDAFKPSNTKQKSSSTQSATRAFTRTKAEQNGCRQRLEGYLSCQQRLPLAVA